MKLLSLEFIVLAVALVFWVRFVRGPLRLIGFLAGSAIYASTFLTPVGRVTIAIFLLAGYALARVAQRWPRLTAPSVALLIAGFVYLRGYDVVVAFLPERFWSVALSIAGLSYLLFKVVHVVVDAAGGRLPHLGLLSYLAYCLNFTTFLLGPIQRYQSFVEQWEGRQEPLEPDMASHFDAVNRVLRGFLKKWVVATVLAKWALLPGESIAGMGFSEVMLGAWLFYVYLYFDFSGYCDVVIGIGRLMGIAPPENFWLPFFSPNIAQYLAARASLAHRVADRLRLPSSVYGLAAIQAASRSQARVAERRHRGHDADRWSLAWDDAVICAVRPRARALSGGVSHDRAYVDRAAGRRRAACPARAPQLGRRRHRRDVHRDRECVCVLRADALAARVAHRGNNGGPMKLAWRFALLGMQIALLTLFARGELDFVYRAF